MEQPPGKGLSEAGKLAMGRPRGLFRRARRMSLKDSKLGSQDAGLTRGSLVVLALWVHLGHPEQVVTVCPETSILDLDGTADSN